MKRKKQKRTARPKAKPQSFGVALLESGLIDDLQRDVSWGLLDAIGSTAVEVGDRLGSQDAGPVAADVAAAGKQLRALVEAGRRAARRKRRLRPGPA